MSWHKRLTTFALIVSLLISGCSSTLVVRENEPLNNDRVFNYDQVNNRLEDVSATIVTRSGTEVAATQAHVAKDSIVYWDTKHVLRCAMATNEIETIYYRDHATGAMTGFFGGLVGGLPVGGLVILLINNHNPEAGLGKLAFLFYSVIGTALVGVAVGAAAGIPVKFQFAQPRKSSLPDSTRVGAP
jgi:hypothetical protein